MRHDFSPNCRRCSAIAIRHDFSRNCTHYKPKSRQQSVSQCSTTERERERESDPFCMTAKEEINCHLNANSFSVVHGGWSQWAESGRTACSKTCGTGSQIITETRTCTNPPPSGIGARPCSGDSSRTSTADCNTQACPGKCDVFHGCFAELCLDVSA